MRNLIILSTIIFAIANISFAQLTGQAKIDSLLKELRKMKEDTNGVYLFANLSFEYSSINPEEGIKYGEQGIKLAKKLDWKQGEARCYHSLGVTYFLGKSNYSKALEYYHKSLKINEEIGNKNGTANNLGKIGVVYRRQSNYTKALEYKLKALNIYEELGDNEGVARTLGNIGNIYENQSDYPKALEYYHRALKINEAIENKLGVAYNLGNIGIIYVNQSDYPKALEYYNNALKLDEELNNKSGVARNLGNIGVIYVNQSDYPKALEYYQKALKINEELGNKSGIANNLGNIGNVYLNQSDYPKALEFYQKALKISEELGDKSSHAVNLGNIGWLYLVQSQDSIINISENKIELMLKKEINLKKSIEYSKQAVERFKELGVVNPQSNFLSNLSEAYLLSRDYKKAYEAFKEHKELQDSVFSMDRQKEIANLEAKRENELKDAEITILKTEKKAQKFQSYLLGGGVVVLLGAFGVAFLRFREKKKLSEKLAVQNSEIENQKRIVESQKEIVEEKNKHIYASIRYASTIQHAILPWESSLKKAFSEILILYYPKDIVSGDSYWYKEVEEIKFLAVIDCTGHGIPGSMLTVIASSVLDDAVLGKRIKNTGEILTYMNDKVTEVLNQRLKENEIRDGMEVALIAIHQDRIQFSGAGLPLYLKNGSFDILKTDRRGIAGRAEDDNYIYTAIDIEKADSQMLYLTTDGFADQMNEEGKKYGSRHFLSLLESIADKPLLEQQQLLEQELTKHQGGRNQIDDITIIGVKL